MVKIGKKEKNDELYKAILQLKDEQECYDFFQDLCTISALRAMAQRFEVASLLYQGMIYNDILERTGASSATISRVNRSLIYGAGGYESVLAVPRDMLIAPYGDGRVNTLRLWEAHSPNDLDMYLFAAGSYVQSLEQRTMAEVITKVLYPADDHIEGKTLRIRQQYFFVSATAQSILRAHRARYGTVRNFAEHHVIQINDTHPTLIIPELMRLLLDDDGLGWDEAWAIVTACVNYTNHTVMSEALETWPQGLIQSQLPRVWEII